MQVPVFFLVIVNTALVLIHFHHARIHFVSAPAADGKLTVQFNGQGGLGAFVVAEDDAAGLGFFSQKNKVGFLKKDTKDRFYSLKPGLSFIF